MIVCISSFGRPATNRPSLTGIATVLTGVEVAWGLVGNLAAEREQGVQEVDDPQYFKAASTLVKIGVGAAVGTAASSAVVGFAAGFGIGTLIDVGAAWLERWENVDDNAAADPLVERTVVEKGKEDVNLAQQAKTELEEYAGENVQWGGWLPEKSHWGARYEGNPAARDTLAKLMKPGKDKDSAPPAKPFRDQTKQFVEKAFTFPTAVGVPPRPNLPEHNTLSSSGSPTRLYLSIIPEYVPKQRGTFMVDAQANTAGMAPVPIQCAVHYVKTPTALRYTVRPKGESLKLPAGTSLSDWADEECWPIGWKEKTPVSGGGTEEKVHFPVHVESGPRIIEWPVQELTKAHMETIDLELGLYRSQQAMKDLSGAEKSRRSEAQRLERTVNPSSVLPVGGIESILKSGQFEVTGTVYFRPLKPFDPDPEMPEADDRFLSRHQLEYIYPRDSRS